MKKLLMGIGSITAFVTPIVTVISCGKRREKKKPDVQKSGSELPPITPQNTGDQTEDSGNETPDPETTDPETTDSETTNSGTTDSGTTDSETTNSGTTDSETTNSGTTNSGTTNSGTTNSGTTDSETTNSGTTNSGTTDSGTTDSVDEMQGSDAGASDEDQQEEDGIEDSDEDQQEEDGIEDSTEDPEDEDERAFLLKVNSLYGQKIKGDHIYDFEVINAVSRIGKKPNIKDIEKLFDLSKEGRVELNDSLGSYEDQMQENEQVEYKITDYLENGDEKTAKFIFKPVETDITIDNSKNWYGQNVQKSNIRDDLYYVEHLEATTWREPSEEDIKNLFNIVGEIQEITNSSELSYLNQLKDETSVNYEIVVKAPFDKVQTFTFQIICPELSVALKDGATLYGNEVSSYSVTDGAPGWTDWWVYNNQHRETKGQEPDTEVIKSMFDFVGKGEVELYGSYGTYGQQMDSWGYATYRISSSGPLQETVEEWLLIYKAR